MNSLGWLVGLGKEQIFRRLFFFFLNRSDQRDSKREIFEMDVSTLLLISSKETLDLGRQVFLRQVLVLVLFFSFSSREILLERIFIDESC